MAETENIARMAERLAGELFAECYWERVGPYNQNWRCVNDAHGRKSHPTDVVFAHNEPYRNRRTFLTCDLKSYARASINKSSLRSALESLSQAVECAQVSGGWKELYQTGSGNYDVTGLLFIYNHDGEFDKSFAHLLREALGQGLSFGESNRVAVLGPQRICYWNTVINDIVALRGRGQIGPRDSSGFFYPDLVDEKLCWPKDRLPATIETILGPFQVYRSVSPGSNGSTVVKLYSQRTGESRDEFIYLLDYLFHYQVVQNANDIEIRLPNAHKNAAAVFEGAKKEYTTYGDENNPLLQRLEMVRFASVPNVIRRFSEVELGMRHE
jgi:hypothetical protein